MAFASGEHRWRRGRRGQALPRVNGMRAVTEAAARHGREVEVDIDPFTDHYRLQWALPDPLPKVSVVIPTKDQPDLLLGCIASIFARSTYADLELVLVDNGSTDRRTLALYESLADSEHDVKVVFDSGYFNFARLNNVGAAAASGEYLVLLNNDTEVVAPDWLEHLLMYAQFDDVGWLAPSCCTRTGASSTPASWVSAPTSPITPPPPSPITSTS